MPLCSCWQLPPCTDVNTPPAAAMVWFQHAPLELEYWYVSVFACPVGVALPLESTYRLSRGATASDKLLENVGLPFSWISTLWVNPCLRVAYWLYDPSGFAV